MKAAEVAGVGETGVTTAAPAGRVAAGEQAAATIGSWPDGSRDAAPRAAGDSPNGVAADSPRAALQDFLEQCRSGRYAAAAGYLDLSPAEAGRGPELARRLEAVFHRHLRFDLAAVSPLSLGDAEDGLVAELEQIATLPGPAGDPEPVRLVRRAEGGEARWVFSPNTVARIDLWFDRLEYRWLLQRLPPRLLRPGPMQILWWQWLALPLLLLVAAAAGLLFSRLSRRFLLRLAGRTETHWDDVIIARIRGPLNVVWILLSAYLLLPWLDLYDPALASLQRVLSSGFLLVFFWFLLRIVDILGQVLTLSPWAADHAAARALVPLGSRVAKVLVLAIAAVALLADFGYPVASLVAGLGIGGIALALAAQKTVENLFGAFSLGVDQPFRQGDFVKIEEFVGTVETVGLRSTRIRTLDRTLISIPNGRLAEMRIESFTARDRMRLAATIGLVYGTTAVQMRSVLEGLEKMLRGHPKIWPDAVVVRFKEFGESSLDIEVMAWFQTAEWSEFQLIRQEVLLQFMEVVEKAGSSFAFPTRTVHLAGGGS